MNQPSQTQSLAPLVVVSWDLPEPVDAVLFVALRCVLYLSSRFLVVPDAAKDWVSGRMRDGASGTFFWYGRDERNP